MMTHGCVDTCQDTLSDHGHCQSPGVSDQTSAVTSFWPGQIIRARVATNRNSNKYWPKFYTWLKGG